MRPVTLTQTGAGSTVPCPMDIRQNPANIALQVTTSGTVNYTVESTDSDVYDSTATLKWTAHPTLAALTADAVGNYAFPPTAIRLTVNSGAGTATLRIVQSGF